MIFSFESRACSHDLRSRRYCDPYVTVYVPWKIYVLRLDVAKEIAQVHIFLVSLARNLCQRSDPFNHEKSFIHGELKPAQKDMMHMDSKCYHRMPRLRFLYGVFVSLKLESFYD